MIAPLIRNILFRLPPVPSKDPIYKGTSTDTVDQTTSTFNNIDIGVPHPRRVIILACFHGVAAAVTGSVNGNSSWLRAQNTAHESGILAFLVPIGTTATITVSATGSVRKAVSVYVAYPESHIPIDSGTATANTTTNANVANQKVPAGGFVIYAGSQLATLGTFTTTWNANGTLTEDVDAQLEATSSYTHGRVTGITQSSDTGDVGLAESTSGTKRLAVMTFGPPPRSGFVVGGA